MRAAVHHKKMKNGRKDPCKRCAVPLQLCHHSMTLMLSFLGNRVLLPPFCSQGGSQSKHEENPWQATTCPAVDPPELYLFLTWKKLQYCSVPCGTGGGEHRGHGDHKIAQRAGLSRHALCSVLGSHSAATVVWLQRLCPLPRAGGTLDYHPAL